MNIGIYAIVNVVNDKCYIGSSNKIKIRWNNHRNLLKNNKHHSNRLQNSYNKHGVANFKYVLLEEVSKEEIIDNQYLTDLEQMYLDTYQPEYNICLQANSTLGYKHSEEHKHRHSQKLKGRKLSYETKQKMSESRKGEKHHMYGKHHSKESKNKMSINKKEKNNSGYWLGKKLPDEVKNKIRKSHEKNIYKIITPSNEEIICTNIAEFCRNNNINNTSLYEVLSGKLKHHKGYKVEKIELI